MSLPRSRCPARDDASAEIALHEVAVRHDRVRAVVDDRVTGAVEAIREKPLGDRHADGVRRPLPERPGRRLDARREPVLGVPRGPAPPLAKRLQVVERQVVAGQVEQAVQQHAAVPGGEHESVAVGPRRVARVVLQVPLPEDVRHRRRAERKARMSGVRLLHGVDRERANRVHAELIDRLANGAQWSSRAGTPRLASAPRAASPILTEE